MLSSQNIVDINQGIVFQQALKASAGTSIYVTNTSIILF